MIAAQSGINWELVGMLAGLLALLGIGYDAAYTRADELHATEGYTWVWIVGGVAAVLVAGAVAMGAEHMIALLALFAAAGAPMALGEMRRHNARRAAAIRAARQEALGEGRRD